jgi:hypothetical protein
MNPFTMERDERNNASAPEWSWGRGMHPDPANSVQEPWCNEIPYEPPQPDDQIRDMQAMKRMNTNDPNAQPDPYVAGNPDRYGPQRPLVREVGMPNPPHAKVVAGPRFRRAE